MTRATNEPTSIPERRTAGHGWAPYLLPYVSFLVLVEIGARVPASAEGLLLLLRVFIPGLFLLYFARCGSYPELRAFRWRERGIFGDVALGLGVGVLWMAPYLFWEGMPHPEPSDAFDPELVGRTGRDLVLGLRFLGFVAITPFVEELFVRSFLLRLIDAFWSRPLRDFRSLPIAQFAWPSFVITVLYFTFSHLPWEYPVAFATGILYNAWLYRRRQIGSLVLVHAVTNLVIYAAVVGLSGRVGNGQGGLLSLWYFL